MVPHTSLCHCLLGTFLLAAGCSAQQEAFLEEETRLHCEIRVACGENLNCEDLPIADGEVGRCTRFRPSKANQCLDELEAHLAMVEEDSATCDESRTFAECDEAMTRRGGLLCKPDIVE